MPELADALGVQQQTSAPGQFDVLPCQQQLGVMHSANPAGQGEQQQKDAGNRA